MKFQPISEQQARRLLPAGEYAFKVLSAEESTRQKTGAPQMNLELEVYDAEGQPHRVYDRLFTDVPAFAHKLRHLCYVGNLDEAYEAGSVEAWALEGIQGHCRIATEPARGDYGPRNSVRDYLGADDKRTPAAKQEPQKGQKTKVVKSDQDDIPF